MNFGIPVEEAEAEILYCNKLLEISHMLQRKGVRVEGGNWISKESELTKTKKRTKSRKLYTKEDSLFDHSSKHGTARSTECE